MQKIVDLFVFSWLPCWLSYVYKYQIRLIQCTSYAIDAPSHYWFDAKIDIFTLVVVIQKHSTWAQTQLEPIQDLNFTFDIQTKACRSLDILFFSIFDTFNTKFVDRATKDCTSSHFQGHFLRIENHFESFWKWYIFGNICLEKATL